VTVDQASRRRGLQGGRGGHACAWLTSQITATMLRNRAGGHKHGSLPTGSPSFTASTHTPHPTPRLPLAPAFLSRAWLPSPSLPPPQ
jgi:hypothetical protein